MVHVNCMSKLGHIFACALVCATKHIMHIVLHYQRKGAHFIML